MERRRRLADLRHALAERVEAGESTLATALMAVELMIAEENDAEGECG